MINFVTKDDKAAKNIAQIRRVVVTWTSLVLGLYIVGICGFLGWSFFWSTKQKKASADLESLSGQVAAYSENQVLLYKVMERSAAVNQFLDQRGDASDAARIILKEGFSVYAWQYTPTGTQKLTILGPGVEELRTYADYLKAYYDKVQVERINWDNETGWSGTFLLSSRRKG